MYIALRDADISIFFKWLFDIAVAVAKVSPSIISNRPSGNVHEHEAEKPKEIGELCIICNKNHLIDDVINLSK